MRTHRLEPSDAEKPNRIHDAAIADDQTQPMKYDRRTQEFHAKQMSLS
jgi:hypothetical protein